MATINFTVEDHNIRADNLIELAQGSHNFDVCNFEFDGSWDGYTKYGIFYQKPKEAIKVALSNNSCNIPAEVLKDAGRLYIGARGVLNGFHIATTQMVSFWVRNGAIDGSTGATEEITASEYEIVMAAVNKANARIDNLIANNNDTEGNSELVDIRVGADGTVYPSAGEAVRQQVSDLKSDLENIKQSGTGTGSSTGWDSTQITLLETLFNYLAFNDSATGQMIADNLISSLRSGSSSSGGSGDDSGGESGGDSGSETPTSYTITNSLTNVATNNTASSIEVNSSYTAKLTADSGYYIDSVVITMGGVNVTDSVYDDGVITISEVTGNIVIVASGAESDNMIVLSECTDGEKMPDGATVTSGTLLVTPLLAVTPGVTYKTNINRTLPDGTNTYSQKIYYYDDSQTYTSVSQLNSQGTINDITNKDVGESYYVRIMFNAQNTNPYFGLSGVIV